MNDAFLLAVTHTLSYEGGYKAAAAGDSETNFGISKRSYPDVNIGSLTRSEAIEIYERDFWNKYQLGAITNPNVAAKILDLLVNHGPDGGARIVQKALGGVGISTNVDGVFGLQTLANCNKAEQLELLAELRAQAAVHYAEIVIHRPEAHVDLLGWMRRATRP